jgi:hypothetical protein
MGDGKTSHPDLPDKPGNPSADSAIFLSLLDSGKFTARSLVAKGVEAILPALLVCQVPDRKVELSTAQETGFQNNFIAFHGNNLATKLAFVNRDAHEDGVSSIDNKGRFTGYNIRKKDLEKAAENDPELAKLTPAFANAQLSGWEIFREAHKDSQDPHKSLHSEGFRLWLKSKGLNPDGSECKDKFTPAENAKLHCLITLVLTEREAASKRDSSLALPLSDLEKKQLVTSRDYLLTQIQSDNKNDLAEKWSALASLFPSGSGDRKNLETAMFWALVYKFQPEGQPESRPPEWAHYTSLQFLIAPVQMAHADAALTKKCADVRATKDDTARLTAQVEFLKGDSTEKVATTLTQKEVIETPDDIELKRRKDEKTDDTKKKEEVSWTEILLKLVGGLGVTALTGYGLRKGYQWWMIGFDNVRAAQEFNRFVVAQSETKRRRSGNEAFRKALETDPRSVTPEQARANFGEVAKFLKKQHEEMTGKDTKNRAKSGGESRDAVADLIKDFEAIAAEGSTVPIPKETPDALIKQQYRELGSISHSNTGTALLYVGRGLGTAASYFFGENASVKDFRTTVAEGLQHASGGNNDLASALTTKPDKSSPDAEIESRLRFEVVAGELNKHLNSLSDPNAKEVTREIIDRFTKIKDGAPLPDQSPQELIDHSLAEMRSAARGRMRRWLSRRAGAALLAVAGITGANDVSAQAPDHPTAIVQPAADAAARLRDDRMSRDSTRSNFKTEAEAALKAIDPRKNATEASDKLSRFLTDFAINENLDSRAADGKLKVKVDFSSTAVDPGSALHKGRVSSATADGVTTMTITFPKDATPSEIAHDCYLALYELERSGKTTDKSFTGTERGLVSRDYLKLGVDFTGTSESSVPSVAERLPDKAPKAAPEPVKLTFGPDGVSIGSTKFPLDEVAKAVRDELKENVDKLKAEGKKPGDPDYDIAQKTFEEHDSIVKALASTDTAARDTARTSALDKYRKAYEGDEGKLAKKLGEDLGRAGGEEKGRGRALVIAMFAARYAAPTAAVIAGLGILGSKPSQAAEIKRPPIVPIIVPKKPDN